MISMKTMDKLMNRALLRQTQTQRVVQRALTRREAKEAAMAKMIEDRRAAIARISDPINPYEKESA